MKRKDFLKLGFAGVSGAFLPISSYSNAKKDLPKVLLLGDSISIGYHPFVVEMMEGKADVTRPFKSDSKPEITKCACYFS